MTALFTVALTSCDKEESNPKEFIVSFETGDGGSAVSSQKVKEGEKATKPNNPTRSGYTFFAWYKETALTNEWKFDTDVVTADITLYAKWNDDEELESGAFDGKITAQVENGNSYNSVIQLVKAEIWDDEADELAVIATGNYSNGGFTMVLPATVKNSLLIAVKEWWDELQNIVISNNNTKITYFEDVIGYNSAGEEVYSFVHNKHNEEGINAFVYYVYADNDVTITGSNYHIICNMSLKKGWNIVYITVAETENGKSEMTTNAVSGLKWFCTKDFEGFDWW